MRKLFLMLAIFILGSFLWADAEEKNLTLEYKTSDLRYCKAGFTNAVVSDFTSVTPCYTDSDPLKLVVNEFDDGTVRLSNNDKVYVYAQMIYAAPLDIIVSVGTDLQDTSATLKWEVALASDKNYKDSITITHMQDDQNILKLGSYELLFRTEDLRGKETGTYKGTAKLEVVAK